jgi:hypothetical protein
MRLSTGWRYATGAACTTAALLFVARAGADEVTLQSGAIVRGHASEVQLPDHSKAVEIRTSTGTLIVFDRDSVKQLKRGAAGQKVVQAANKPRLTAKQQAWMTKVRSLVSRLTSGNRAQAQRARDELLKIDDPDALPALTRYLQQNPDEELRQIYVAILRYLPGSSAVYYLVSQSLFDSSAQIRQQAREAIGAERADSARTLYVFALKLRDPNLATRAALGIQQIGDPNGDAIPYLIDNLVYVGAREIDTPQVTWVGWTAQFVQCGGPNFTGPTWFSEMGGLGGNVGGSPSVQIYGGGRMVPDTPGAGPIVTTVARPRTTFVAESTNNPAVLEILLKLSDQPRPGFGYQAEQWRRWWDNEKASRDSRKRAAD